LRFPFAIQTRETSETASETLPQLPPIVPKSETNRKGVSNQKASSSTRGVLKKKNVAFEASFSCVFGAGPHRIHPKTPSGQPQKRCTFAFQCIQHVLIAELHLAFNFQPFVKFPDSRNSAFKAFSEGAAVVNARSGHGIYHIVFTLRHRRRRHYPQYQCLPPGASLFEGYLGGAGIVRCCVSRMRVGCSQKGSDSFLLVGKTTG
jgi:hypothetical protein